MELKEAYKEAFKEELQPLVDSGKLVLLNTLEDMADELSVKFCSALKKGAALSKTPVDDMIVAPFAGYLETVLLTQADKINPHD